MKRLFPLALALVLLLCACTAQQPADSTGAAQSQTQSDPTTQSTAKPATDPTDVTHPALTRPHPLTEVPINATGSVRTGYTIPMSSVRYITSVEELPKNDALKGYDAAYFETGALVLVLESVSSASVRVDIESIDVYQGVARVTLSHEPQGDMGIPTMTTWMIWAEVQSDVDLKWAVVNPAMDSEIKQE